jgi:DNA-directed RNA polymerase-3 subunit RPC5
VGISLTDTGRLHLHPISQTHQLRPTQTYLDVLSRKQKRSLSGDDSDSDDGPPPDPDEPVPPPVVKKEKKAGETREVQLTARKADVKGSGPSYGGISAVRREILQTIRVEEDESWEDLEFHDIMVRILGISIRLTSLTRCVLVRLLILNRLSKVFFLNHTMFWDAERT